MADRIPPFRNEKFSIQFPGGQGIVGYPTEEEMATAIKDAIDAIDWDSFATDAEVLAAIQAVEGAINALATEAWVTQQIGEAVAAASLNALSPEQIAEIAAQVGDLSQYSTTEQVNAAIAAAITTLGEQVGQAVEDAVTNSNNNIQALAEAIDAELGGKVSQADYDQLVEALGQLNMDTRLAILEQFQAATEFALDEAGKAIAAKPDRSEIIPTLDSVGDIPADAPIGSPYLVNGLLFVVSDDGPGEVGPGDVTIHDNETPPTAPSATPRPGEMIALYDGLDEGLHLYRKDSVSWLLMLGRKGSEQVTVTVLGPTHVEAVFRDMGSGESRMLMRDGLKYTLMTSPNGGTPLSVVEQLDLTDLSVDLDNLTPEQLQSIIDAIPEAPVTAEALQQVADDVANLDELYGNMLTAMASWTQEIGKKAALTDDQQTITAMNVKAGALSLRGDDFVLSVIDTPTYDTRLALLRTDTVDLDAADFVLTRKDGPDLIAGALDQVEVAGEWKSLPIRNEIVRDKKFPYYRTLPGGNIQIVGDVRFLTGANFPVDVATALNTTPLPNIARPQFPQSYVVSSFGGDPGGAFCTIDIGTDGMITITPRLTSPRSVDLAGIYLAGAWPSTLARSAGIDVLNEGTKETLLLLPGVGEQIADAIIAYRESHGSITADDLVEIPGLGEAKVEAIKEAL